MLILAGHNCKISIAVLDKKASPAKLVNNVHPGVDGSFTDLQAIRQLAGKYDILTVEIEHVDTYMLEELKNESLARGKKIEIQPSWETIRIVQDKYLQKQHLVNANAQIDVAESRPIATVSKEEIQRVSKQLGLPFMLKIRQFLDLSLPIQDCFLTRQNPDILQEQITHNIEPILTPQAGSVIRVFMYMVYMWEC